MPTVLKTVIAICLLFLTGSALANDTQKINTVKNIYKQATAISKKGGNGEILNAKYATPKLAASIKQYNNYMKHYDMSEGPDDCSDSMPKLVEGNGYGLDNAHTSRFYVDKNKRVVAELTFKAYGGGQPDVSKVAFDLVCSSGGCKVDDIIQMSYGGSFRADVAKYCR